MSISKSAYPLLAIAFGAVVCGTTRAWAAGPDPGINVTVTNPPSKPVPVSIQGTISSNVTVANVPLPVSVVSETPVAFELVPTGDNTNPKFHVPTGQRLVIEYISALCHPSAQAVGKAIQIKDVAITAVTGGISNTHRLTRPINPLVFDDTLAQPADQLLLNIGHLVKIYADPGTDVGFAMDGGQCDMTFSGQLVPI